MHPKTFLLGACLTVATFAATAQSFPIKPIRLVVTFPAAGAPDILARLFADKAQFGQPVVVDNKPGAGGNIGADMVAKAPADGHTLVMGTVGTHSINGALYSKMPYDMVKDFAPVAHVASAPKREMVARINTEMQRVFTLPDVVDELKTLGLEPWISTPEELGSYQAREITKWAKVVMESGAKAD